MAAGINSALWLLVLVLVGSSGILHVDLDLDLDLDVDVDRRCANKTPRRLPSNASVWSIMRQREKSLGSRFTSELTTKSNSCRKVFLAVGY